ncbi:MAG: TlpA family protein disulfide reductase [Gemmatimonadetes bacterium]|nr:TlpA family protein disulfide reductase [Gemmatimonadota bacterium]NNK64735.1 TlpA family protein disulfide reductase [Gemmatimonadota bacterium]
MELHHDRRTRTDIPTRASAVPDAPARARRVLLAVAAALAATLVVPGLAAGQGVGLDIGTPAPAVEVEDLDGNTVQIADYIEPGKLTLLEFWATWCENCEALQPQLDQIHAEYGDRVNVVAVAVAVAQSQRRVRRHIEDHGAGYPYLWDGAGAAVRAYNAATTSIVMLVDGEGMVVYSGVGGDQDLVGEVERRLGTQP